jgi:trans-aconitate methyltransferase
VSFLRPERFFRPGYSANLVQNWIPSLDGVEAKLKAGARVADVGRSHDASTIVMARAYPKSKFFGFDYHQPSLDRAATREFTWPTQGQTDMSYLMNQRTFAS